MAICETIFQNIATCFAFDSNKDEAVNIIHDVLTIIEQFGVSESRIIDIIDKIVAMSLRTNGVIARRLMIVTFSVLFDPKTTDTIQMDYVSAHRFRVWLRITAHIPTILQHSEDSMDADNNSIISHESFYQYLYWPLSVTLLEQDVSKYYCCYS